MKCKYNSVGVIVNKIKRSIRYYQKKYEDMPIDVAKELALSRYMHSKKYLRIKEMIENIIKNARKKILKD